MSLANTIHHSTFIYNQFKKLNLCLKISKVNSGNIIEKKYQKW